MKKHFFYIITVWFLLTQTLPPINRLFPVGGALTFAVFCGATIVLFPHLLTKRSIIMLIIYALMTFVYFISGNAFFDEINTVLVPFVIMLSGLLLAEYTLKYDADYKYTKLVVVVVFAANIVMTIISIPQVLLYPNIIRPTDINELNYGEIITVISYQTCHGLPILFAPLIFLCRRCFMNNKRMFAVWIVVSILLFYIVYKSNATTSLLVSIIMIAVAFLFKAEQFTKRNIAAMAFVGVLSIVIFQPGVMVPIISTVQSTMDPGTGNYKKMEEIKDDFIYGEADGDWGARQALYEQSSNLFFDSPIFGTTSPELIAHHSWLLDRLACFGILFIIPLVLVLWYNFKAMYRCLRHTQVVYVFGISGLIFMLYMKNDFGQGTWLYGFAFLPLLCRYIDNVIDSNRKGYV